MVKCKFQRDKNEWEDGTIETVHSSDNPRVEYHAEDGPKQKHVLPASSITGHQRSKKKPMLRLVGGETGAAFVFAFDSQSERDAMSEEIQSLGAGAKMQSSREQPDTATRNALLHSDPELNRVYQELVQSGAISEEEFWAERQEMLDEAKGRAKGSSYSSGTTAKQPQSKQRTGIVSMMQPVSHDTQNMTRSYKLTKQQMQQIFTEQPAVRRAYLANVPAKMSEHEFWSSYFKAETLREVRRHTGAMTQEEQRLMNMFADSEDLRKQTMNRRISRVDPSVNLALSQYDQLLPGYGTTHAGHKDEWSCEGAFFSAGRSVGDVIRNVNTHGEAVLEGPPANGLYDFDAAARDAEKRVQEDANLSEQDQNEALGKRYEQLQSELHIDELGSDSQQNSQKAKAPTINVTNPRVYFLRNRQAGDETAVAEQRKERKVVADTDVQAAIRSAKAGRGRCALDSEGAISVLEEITTATKGSNSFESPNARLGKAEALPDGVREELRMQQRTVQELLRHFWRSIPATTQSKQEKISRVMASAQRCRQRIDGVKTSLPPAQRHAASIATKPLLQALDAAFDALDTEQSSSSTMQIPGRA